MLADLADELDMRLSEERLDFRFEVISVDPVDLGGDLQPHAGSRPYADRPGRRPLPGKSAQKKPGIHPSRCRGAVAVRAGHDIPWQRNQPRATARAGSWKSRPPARRKTRDRATSVRADRGGRAEWRGMVLRFAATPDSRDN